MTEGVSESGEELVSANSNDEDAARRSDGGIDKQLIQSIPVTVTAELGRTKIKLRDLLRLTQGSVLELDREAGELLDLKVNETIIAKGEVVNVGESLGLSIVEIVSPMDRIKTS